MAVPLLERRGILSKPTAPPLGAYPAAVIADTPIHYWRAGDAIGSGVLVDLVGAENLTLQGAAGTNYALGRTSLVAGDTDTALQNKTVTGGGARRAASSIGAAFASHSFTVEMWVQPENLIGNTQALWQLNASTGMAYLYGYTDFSGSANHVGITYWGDLAYVSPRALNVGGIYHLVWVYDASIDQTQIYVNGVLVGTSAAGPYTGSGVIDFELAMGDLAQAFLGVIDEVALYNYALPAARVTAHYNVGKSTVSYHDAVLAEPSLLSYWRLAEAAGAMVDQKGVVNGTVNGGSRAVAGLLAGDADKGWAATADGDYVDFGANYDMAGTGSFTVELIVKPSTVAASHPIVGRHDGNNKGWMLVLDSDTGVIDFFANAEAYPQFPAGSASAGVVKHIAAVRDTVNGKKLAFVNGVQVGTFDSGVTAITTPGAGVPFRLGTIPVYGTVMPGTYDELALYGAALPVATIISHAQKAGLA